MFRTHEGYRQASKGPGHFKLTLNQPTHLKTEKRDGALLEGN